MFSVTLDLRIFVLVAVKYLSAVKLTDRVASLFVSLYVLRQCVPGTVEPCDVLGEYFLLRHSVLWFALAN